MDILIVFLAWGLFGWSWLAILRTPDYRLWKAGVAATEWGHWLGWMSGSFALAAALGGAGAWVVGPGVGAAFLFHTPLLRAAYRSRRLGVELDRVLERPGPRTDAACRRAPLKLGHLPHLRFPASVMEVHVYRRVDGIRLSLDLYRSPRGRPAPVVLVVHGGSWSGGDSSQLSGMNRYLAASGYAVAAINYRLAPRYRFPSQVEDIRAALAFLAEHGTELGIDADRVVLLGRSSGGHLALTLAYSEPFPAIRGVVAFYAPTDLIWSWHRPAPKRIMDSNAVIVDFLGGDLDAVPELFAAASPIRLLDTMDTEAPPTLLVHGGNDALVSRDQSRRLAAALQRRGVAHFHLELPWGKHGMDANLAGPAGQMTLYTLERFLDFTLTPAGRS